MHPKHKVVVSINPPDGTYQVATLDRALLDRMVMIYVGTDYQCWARYASAQDFDESVRQYLALSPNLLALQGSTYDLQVEPTERAWEMVSLLRKNCRLPRDLEAEVFAGVVGQEAAVAFLRWCESQQERPLTADEILNHWPDVSARAGQQRDDLQAASINMQTAELETREQLTLGHERFTVSHRIHICSQISISRLVPSTARKERNTCCGWSIIFNSQRPGRDLVRAFAFS